MSNKKIKLLIGAVVVLAVAGIIVFRLGKNKNEEESVKEITPAIGSIRNLISSTGTVLPKNRLEIKPPVNGRIEKILVREGDMVKTGQILAWMSSTERAALLDAARGQGDKAVEYWQETYKPIPLPAPIDAEVIVATTQPGQTIITSDAVLVLSDHLIVRAQVDETDIGKIAEKMQAIITLDAYPDTKIKATVEHIYYESQTVNNVTVYMVDVIPEEVPQFLRSGMNASVDFIVQERENVLVIPVDMVDKENHDTYVFIKQDNGTEPIKRRVQLGISDDKNIEVISGVTQKDRIIAKTKKYVLPKSAAAGTNPFMPRRH
jgi:macrolide-specific efflux system membrane fusion protein